MSHDSGVRQEQPIEIFVSLAAFRHASLIEAVVRNVLTYTQPKALALHISHGSAHDKPTLRRLRQHERLVLNPRNVVIRKHGPEVLGVHLSNVALLDRLPVGKRPSGRDRILLLPGNAVLFRPCAPLIRRAPISFAPGQFSDFAAHPATSTAHALSVHAELPLGVSDCLGDGPLHERFGWSSKGRAKHAAHGEGTSELTNKLVDSAAAAQRRLLPADLRWRAFWKPPPSTAWDVFMRAVREGDDDLMRRDIQCERNHFWRGFFEWAGQSDVRDMHDGRKPPMQWPGKPPPIGLFERKPLAHTIHEGSWYPATVLRAAMAAFAGGPLSVLNLTSSQWGCPHRGFCALEEHALPTFAWQRYPRLVAHARPPVVARVLDFSVSADKCVRSPCTRACRESTHAFPALLDAVAAGSDLWCAVKIAKDTEHEATTEHLLAEVARCSGFCGCSANESAAAYAMANESTTSAQ